MKNLILFFLCLEAACSSFGCGLDVGTSDCEKVSAAVEAAAVRCKTTFSGHSCSGVIASSIGDADGCVAWFETSSCEELYADKYYAEKCHIALLVSPL